MYRIVFTLSTLMSEAWPEKAIDIQNCQKGDLHEKDSYLFIDTFFLGISGCAAETVPATEPPSVTKVVLYKHGMGYLEREGKN